VRQVFKALVCALALLMLGTGSASAAGPSRSPLPGYPRFRGVMLVHDGSSATAAREDAIRSALKAAASSTSPDCRTNVNPGADLCYWGGPVVRAHTVHLIFWGATGGTSAEATDGANPFPAGYVTAIERYFSDVAQVSQVEASSNVYAVGSQYGSSNGPAEYKVTFHGAPTDVFIDHATVLPAAGSSPKCEDGTFTTCITDADLQNEIKHAMVEKTSWKSTLQDIYFVFTPPNVGSCFGPGSSSEGNACALVPGGYCAYHSSFENVSKEAVPPLYANLPDDSGIVGCDSFEYPNSPGGVDATIDTTSHEHVETITDPLGSGWFDVIGQEISDKCLPPETFDIYGGAFGGVPATETTVGTLYNQIIGSGHYWLQREWSNEAGLFEGGCVQRAIGASFTVSAGAAATVPVTLDGSSSGAPGDPAAYWVWNFLDGEQIGTVSPTISHTFVEASEQLVALTAYDEYGNAEATVEAFNVGPAPPPPPPPVTPAPLIVKEPVTPGHLTAAQLAAKLGLPGNGKRLSGGGSIALGHAECPPACAVTLRIYAKVTTVVRKRRSTKLVAIGTAHMTFGVKGTGRLALTLNAKGRALLRKSHPLACKLVVTVEGQEGGTWQIVRSLTLTR